VHTNIVLHQYDSILCRSALSSVIIYYLYSPSYININSYSLLDVRIQDIINRFVLYQFYFSSEKKIFFLLEYNKRKKKKKEKERKKYYASFFLYLEFKTNNRMKSSYAQIKLVQTSLCFWFLFRLFFQGHILFDIYHAIIQIFQEREKKE
jgi:hypothetical protein